MRGRGLHRAQSITLEADRVLFFGILTRVDTFPLVPRAEDVISGLVDRFGEDKLALAASWQKETAVLVDMVTRIAPGARIFTLDTGALFEETYATWRLVE
jgi:hypothetical protein